MDTFGSFQSEAIVSSFTISAMGFLNYWLCSIILITLLFYHSNESFHRIALDYTLEIICSSSSNNLTTARRYIVDGQDQVWVLRHVCAPSYKKFYLGKGTARATKSMSELSDMSMHLRPSCPKFHAPSVRLIHRFKSITQPAVNMADTCIQRFKSVC